MAESDHEFQEEEEEKPDKGVEVHAGIEAREATIAELRRQIEEQTATIASLELRIAELSGLIESRHERGPSESHIWFKKIGN